MKHIPFVLLLCLLATFTLASGCATSDGQRTNEPMDVTQSTEDTGATPTSAACLEQQRLAADECYTLNCLEAAPQTCTYDTVSASGDDCGCYTLHDLYEALCIAGNTDTAEVLQAGLSCD